MGTWISVILTAAFGLFMVVGLAAAIPHFVGWGDSASAVIGAVFGFVGVAAGLLVLKLARVPPSV